MTINFIDNCVSRFEGYAKRISGDHGRFSGRALRVLFSVLMPTDPIIADALGLMCEIASEYEPDKKLEIKRELVARIGQWEEEMGKRLDEFEIGADVEKAYQICELLEKPIINTLIAQLCSLISAGANRAQDSTRCEDLMWRVIVNRISVDEMLRRIRDEIVGVQNEMSIVRQRIEDLFRQVEERCVQKITGLVNDGAKTTDEVNIASQLSSLAFLLLEPETHPMPRNHDVRVYAKLTAARARAARSLYSGDVERLGQIAKQTERWKGRSSSHGLMLSVLQTMGMEEFTDLVGISTLLQSEMLNEREMKIADFWRSSGYQILQKCAKQISELAPKEAMRYRQVAEELAPELWKMERVAELYKEGTSSSVVDSDPKRALALLEEAQSLGRNLCDPAFDKWLEYVKDQVGKAEKAVRFAELYKEGTSSVVDSDPKRALALLEEAKILDEDLCDSTFHTLLKDVKQKVSSPSPLEPSSKEQIIELSQSKEIIDRYRPTTLPERVSRGACHFSIELPQKKGALVDLPTLPEGLEQRWIITPQGTPLIEMVKIPAGKAKFGEEKRELELEEYWIARTPVTNLMWLQFVKESQYQPTSDDHDGEYLKHWQDDQPPEELLEHPVVNVSYINAWAFCDYNGLSLPSEAQWEKAARGTNGRTYPWGNQPEPNGELCNFNSPISTTTPVNKYPDGASLYGLLDCAGNVREWCADEYQSNWLDIIANANTRHIICSCNNYADSTFALRGGSFDVMAEDVQCAARYRIKARNCFINFGFRPVFPRT